MIAMMNLIDVSSCYQIVFKMTLLPHEKTDSEYHETHDKYIYMHSVSNQMCSWVLTAGEVVFNQYNVSTPGTCTGSMSPNITGYLGTPECQRTTWLLLIQ